MRKLVLCHKCEGRGNNYRHEITDYHKNDYDVIITPCKRCNGTGRLWEIVTVIYEVYND